MFMVDFWRLETSLRQALSWCKTATGFLIPDRFEHQEFLDFGPVLFLPHFWISRFLLFFFIKNMLL